MPKPPTYPTLYDNLKTLSITFLSKYGYLKPNQWQTGTVKWSLNGIKTGTISIQVNTQPGNPYLELNYKCNETPISYRVQLASVRSNLGKGIVWFFVCPATGKRCRKLYLADTYFYHRSAFTGCMYEKQTLSRKGREFEQTMGLLFKNAEISEQVNKKYFKARYAGKPTKKYLKLLEQLKKINLSNYIQ